MISQEVIAFKPDNVFLRIRSQRPLSEETFVTLPPVVTGCRVVFVSRASRTAEIDKKNCLGRWPMAPPKGSTARA
jgi:hypothetical protein